MTHWGEKIDPSNVDATFGILITIIINENGS